MRLLLTVCRLCPLVVSCDATDPQTPCTRTSPAMKRAVVSPLEQQLAGRQDYRNSSLKKKKAIRTFCVVDEHQQAGLEPAGELRGQQRVHAVPAVPTSGKWFTCPSAEAEAYARR
jgi:hypothetical protein